jgi:hypothetical protein
MTIDERGSVSAKIIGKGDRSTLRKPAPVPLSSSKIPRDDLKSKPGCRGGKPARNRLSTVRPYFRARLKLVTKFSAQLTLSGQRKITGLYTAILFIANLPVKCLGWAWGDRRWEPVVKFSSVSWPYRNNEKEKGISLWFCVLLEILRRNAIPLSTSETGSEVRVYIYVGSYSSKVAHKEAK